MSIIRIISLFSFEAHRNNTVLGLFCSPLQSAMKEIGYCFFFLSFSVDWIGIDWPSEMRKKQAISFCDILCQQQWRAQSQQLVLILSVNECRFSYIKLLTLFPAHIGSSPALLLSWSCFYFFYHFFRYIFQSCFEIYDESSFDVGSS